MAIRNPQIIVVLIMVLIALAGCGASEELAQMPAEQRFQLAMKKFQDEDYLEAREEFRIITLQYQGSALADDAQYYFAETYFRRAEYTLAAYEYDLLTKTMPTSEYVARARYKRALCHYQYSQESRPYYLEQDDASRAIDEFQTFIEYHPTDSLVADAEAKITELNAKLARKEYENGIIYMKMEYYRAATNSFEAVLEKYHDTPYAEPAHLKKVEALLLRKRYGEAKQEIERFLSRYPNSSRRREAEQFQREIMSKLSQGASDVSKGLEALAGPGRH